MQCINYSDMPRPFASELARFPVGMAYVPIQQWMGTYSIEQGIRRGTMFPQLDLPFLMGRCAK